VFEGNQLLRIEPRQIGLNLDVVLIAIFWLKRANPRVLISNVALGEPPQLHTPINQHHGIISFGSQQLLDLCEHKSSSSPRKRYAVQLRVSLQDHSFDSRYRPLVPSSLWTTTAALSRL
jgi:hypothetical protein